MRTSYLLLAAIVIMAMALSACGNTANAGYPAPAPSMSVTGNAQIGLTPDVAYIYIGVHGLPKYLQATKYFYLYAY